MSIIGKVDGVPGDTIGMINAKRLSDLSMPILAGAIWGLLGWRWAVIFVGLAWMIRVEARRIREALWPQCYHAIRLVMDEHGIEFGGGPVRKDR